jgi:hypothetical protein
MAREEDEDLTEVPNPADQYLKRSTQENMKLLSPFMRQIFERENRDHLKSVQEWGGSVNKAFLNRVTIEMGAQGHVNAGGERKGGYVSLESGAAGIVAAGGQKTGDHVSIGMGAAGIVGQNRAYLRKKRGGGALAGARYGTPEMFPGKFPNIVAGPKAVGWGRSGGGVNLNLLAAGQRGFANLA